MTTPGDMVNNPGADDGPGPVAPNLTDDLPPPPMKGLPVIDAGDPHGTAAATENGTIPPAEEA